MSKQQDRYTGVGGAKSNFTRLVAMRAAKRSKPGSGADSEELAYYEVTTESEPEVSEQEATEPPKEAIEPPKEATEPPKEATETPKEATEPPKEATETPKEATEPPTEGGCPGDVELGPVWYTKGIDGRLMKCHSPYTILDTRDKKTGMYQIVPLSGLTVKGYGDFPYNMYDNASKSDHGVALYFKKQHCNVNLTIDKVMHNIFGIHFKWRPATPEEEAAYKRY